ncbi:uncharacterized protein HaLaN_00222 [Haematococcus lacustris]|uniref:WW domain-containing oxidoreductase n=1 Tax=Haematococcus lacustris TaxID=44745 RepID=A0A699YCZ2_HAELA|nr:uncharacterized protein HaLaN_00222 [Haematococcus lacustris]
MGASDNSWRGKQRWEESAVRGLVAQEPEVLLLPSTTVSRRWQKLQAAGKSRPAWAQQIKTSPEHYLAFLLSSPDPEDALARLAYLSANPLQQPVLPLGRAMRMTRGAFAQACPGFRLWLRKVAVVTGANSGIGYETTRKLAENGAEVYMVVRNMDKGRAAVEQLRKELGPVKLHLLQADFESMREVLGVAAELKGIRIDLLISIIGTFFPGPFKMASAQEQWPAAGLTVLLQASRGQC